ncbi:MAG: tRNA preQ1(34) S-adenosylmethionine ribosyltransferase-isomerase QueA, partial [Pusillimonas sp.]|nr:tRNA preQ1(34) S-adenosylmethionine ribosyltransferase-isomerase QueA [Pusillimonas sp.]
QSHIHDRQFHHLPELLRAGDLLVFNNTKVIKARLLGQKDTGGKVELLIERITGDTQALSHIKSSKSPKPGTVLHIAPNLSLTVTGREGELFSVQFPVSVLDALEEHGMTPLPPYIKHTAHAQDEARYQTVYAQEPGAVAAPTAGLHFDNTMLAQLEAQGVRLAFVTLHVGAGTFQPVRVEKLAEHKMHFERYTVSAETLTLIDETRKQGRRVIAVGTTSVRALESAAKQGKANQTHLPISGDTNLFITPGYRFALVDALVTNFHLPRSTLLMLVSALAGMTPIKQAYKHAVAQQYRFFSYGDAMFIETPST